MIGEKGNLGLTGRRGSPGKPVSQNIKHQCHNSFYHQGPAGPPGNIGIPGPRGTPGKQVKYHIVLSL